MKVAFKQVDVFTSSAFRGNPLAVIMDAQGLSDAQLAAIARWTNLPEPTFVLPPKMPGRIIGYASLLLAASCHLPDTRHSAPLMRCLKRAGR